VFGPSDETFDAVRESFAASRRRGVTFGHAWRLAMEDVPMGPAMRAVMRDTRHAWARAYNGTSPTPTGACWNSGARPSSSRDRQTQLET
jgi:hypothetical protein